VKGTVPLVKAQETALFGSKAVGLGQAIRDGLPVPPGFTISTQVTGASDALAYGTAVVLIALVLTVNLVSIVFRVRLRSRRKW